ncbi:MAG TPA: hypothetical protein VFG01_08750 [Acidobacteriota bacterium]|nr:hypothetical protein [Acidobacteriota bacterium]
MKEKNEDRENFFNEKLKGRTQEHKLQVYLIKSIDNLRESTEKSSEKAKDLSKKIFWLNVVLAAATLIGAFATFWMVFIN